jgi:hypothetical protein
VWVTGQALAAVKQKAFPLAPVARAGGGKRAGEKAAAGDQASGSAGSAGPPAADVPTGDSGAAGAAPKGAGAAATPPVGAAPVQPGAAPTSPAEAVQAEPLESSSAEEDSDDGWVPGWVFLAAGTAVVAAAIGSWLRRSRSQSAEYR